MVTFVFFFVLLSTNIYATKPKDQCEAGFTGENCKIPCQASCKTCDRENQDCTGHCRHKHRFGKLCDQICPQFCNGTCNITTGSCFKCYPTYGGSFCNISCPTSCRSTCDMNTLECDHCKTNFTGAFCNDTCQEGHSNTSNIKSCIEPCLDEANYGDDCDKLCPENCKNGCYRDAAGECVNCAEGFGGRFCNVSCPENCFKGCDRYHGTCNNCKVGYSGDKCSDKCPANCKGKCDKNTVNCIACKSGFQGESCTENCTQNCNGSCDQTTGICKTCETGFRGHFCNESRGEQIGRECIECTDEDVGSLSNDTNCDQDTGECELQRSTRPKHQDKIPLTVACAAVGGSLVVVSVSLTFVFRRRPHGTRQTQKDNVGLVANYISRIDDDETTTSVGTNVENSRLTNYEDTRVPMKHVEENASINLEDTEAEVKRPDASYQIDYEDAIEGEDHQKANQTITNHCMGVGDQSDVPDTEKSTTGTNVDEDEREDDVATIDEKHENLKEEAPEKIYVDIMAVRGY